MGLTPPDDDIAVAATAAAEAWRGDGLLDGDTVEEDGDAAEEDL